VDFVKIVALNFILGLTRWTLVLAEIEVRDPRSISARSVDEGANPKTGVARPGGPPFEEQAIRQSIGAVNLD